MRYFTIGEMIIVDRQQRSLRTWLSVTTPTSHWSWACPYLRQLCWVQKNKVFRLHCIDFLLSCHWTYKFHKLTRQMLTQNRLGRTYTQHLGQRFTGEVNIKILNNNNNNNTLAKQLLMKQYHRYNKQQQQPQQQCLGYRITGKHHLR